MMKILVKWLDTNGVPHFNSYEADGGYIFDKDIYIFDKDMGDFNNVEYIMIREVKNE